MDASLIIAPPLPAGLDTPALVIDLDVVERNAARLADRAWPSGGSPSGRTPRRTRASSSAGSSSRTARVGLTVGNLGEAEVFAGGGLRRTCSSPTRSGRSATRRRACARCTRTIGWTCPSGSTPSRAPSGSRPRSPGSRRRLPRAPGARPGQPPDGRPARGRRRDRVGRRASSASRCAALFTHGGHGYQSREATITGRRGRGPGADDRARRAPRRRDRAGRHQRRLHADPALGRPVARSPRCAPAPTSSATASSGRSARSRPTGSRRSIAATVVSTAVDGQVVVDAGAKALTKDVAPYLDGHGAIPAYPGRGHRAGERLPRHRPHPGRDAVARRSARSSPSSRTTSARSSTCATRFVGDPRRRDRRHAGRSTRAAGAADGTNDRLNVSGRALRQRG